LISGYFRDFQLLLEDTKIIADKYIDLREFSATEGMLSGRLLLVDGSMLEFMEYLKEENRLKYRFHLINKEGDMVFRYDNAPHHRDISSFPHHKHLPGNVSESIEKSIMDVLDEIETLISNAMAIKEKASGEANSQKDCQ
jgi:hypothetical protein